jgi:hypothetical protein
MANGKRAIFMHRREKKVDVGKRAGVFRRPASLPMW